MRHVLVKPILSEKSTRLADQGQYVFEVYPSANKIEIRRAIEDRYGVGVSSVRTITVHPRLKVQMTKRGFTSGKTARRKKAVVTLKKGQRLDLYGDGTGEA